MKKLFKSEICGSHILFTVHKKIEKSTVAATVHMNSSHCPLIECAAAGKKKKRKKKKKVKKRKRKRRSWIQTQPYSILHVTLTIKQRNMYYTY